MNIETALFGMASLALVALCYLSAKRNPLSQHVLASLMILAMWGIAAGVRPFMDWEWADYLIPGLAIIGAMVSVVLFENRPALWKLVLALSYVFEIGAYITYRLDINSGWRAIHDCELRLNVTFAAQLCLVAAEPADNVTRRWFDVILNVLFGRVPVRHYPRRTPSYDAGEKK